MTTTQLWLIYRAVLLVLPVLVWAVREGHIRKVTSNEIASAIKLRADAALRAGNAASIDELHDPNRRD